MSQQPLTDAEISDMISIFKPGPLMKKRAVLALKAQPPDEVRKQLVELQAVAQRSQEMRTEADKLAEKDFAIRVSQAKREPSKIILTISVSRREFRAQLPNGDVHSTETIYGLPWLSRVEVWRGGKKIDEGVITTVGTHASFDAFTGLQMFGGHSAGPPSLTTEPFMEDDELRVIEYEPGYDYEGELNPESCWKELSRT